MLFRSSIALIFFAIAAATCLGQTGSGYVISQSVTANGGLTQSRGGAFSVAGTIGQSVAGQPANATGYDIYAGFWTPPTILAPTAALVTAAGRVQTADGRGIRNALVTLVNAGGIRQTAVTGAFGYFRFDGVEAGLTYVISVSTKQYVFAQPSQIVAIQDSADEIIFVADPH